MLEYTAELIEMWQMWIETDLLLHFGKGFFHFAPPTGEEFTS